MDKQIELTMGERIVVYTANFGGYDYVREPLVRPATVDYVYFTDEPVATKHWKVLTVPVWNNDPVRSARKIKILPHTLFPDHQISIWVDANITVRGDVSELVDQYLTNANMVVYSHAVLPDRSLGVQDQLQSLLQGKRGVTKDDPEVMQKQVEGYLKEGFPDDGGMLCSMVLLRRHHDPTVTSTMNCWWEEVAHKSRRDQLSFPYAAWKHQLSYTYITDNVRDNGHFKHTTHQRATIFDKFWWLFSKKIPQIVAQLKGR